MVRDRLVEALAQEFPGSLEESGGRALFLPRGDDELSEALRIATRLGAPLSAPGGRHRDESVRVDLRRMADLLVFDATSQLAHIEAGCTVADLEETLSSRGLTLGCGEAPKVPIGTWLANGAAGARDRDADPVDQLVAGLSAVLSDGRRLHIRPAPRRAAGPDLVAALIGGRGRLGVITSAHLVVRPKTAITAVTFSFDSEGAAASGFAWMRGHGVRPVRSGIRVDASGRALLTLHLDGPERLREVKAGVARRVAEDRGGVAAVDDAAPAGTTAIARSRSVDSLAAKLDPGHVLG